MSTSLSSGQRKSSDQSWPTSNNQNTLHPSDIVSQHTEQQIQYSLNQAIMDGDLQEIENIINGSSIDVHKMKDARKYTVLHRACLNSKKHIAAYIIQKAKQELANKRENFVKYLNAQTNEGFTGLHFASFKGDIVDFWDFQFYALQETMDLLIKEGADQEIRNYKQVNMVHIAAQGDQPISLAYFRKIGLDLNKKDGKGSTPLHWAAYLASENAVNFLSSWEEIDLNAQDKDGLLTPLHLAVMSGNSKVVHKLLIRGADKCIEDRDSKTPRMLAIENEYNNIAMLLEDETLMEQCTKTGTFKEKPKQTRKFVFAFIIMMIIAQLSIYFFLIPYSSRSFMVIIEAALFVLVLFFHLLSWITNPGYLLPYKQQDLLDILSKVENFKVCPDCEILKPKRSKHCEICQSCVKVFDHHCPWINNCVGAGNHIYFLFYIFSFLLFLLYNLIFVIYSKLFQIFLCKRFYVTKGKFAMGV